MFKVGDKITPKLNSGWGSSWEGAICKVTNVSINKVSWECIESKNGHVGYTTEFLSNSNHYGYFELVNTRKRKSYWDDLKPYCPK